jgi:orotate phosphoribosyltransferase
MKDEELLNIFRATGAMLQGHFLLSSGLHSSHYLQCALVLQHPACAEQLGRALAERVVATVGHDCQFVMSPAMGGIVIGYETARALDAPAGKVRALFTERTEGMMTLRRGFQIVAGERGIVVEDVITTGGSTKETMDVVRSAGGIVAAVASIIDRSQGAIDFSVPNVSLLRMEVPNYPPSDCPLCREQIPLVKPGSRNVKRET